MTALLGAIAVGMAVVIAIVWADFRVRAAIERDLTDDLHEGWPW
jgi:hypothetical protein